MKKASILTIACALACAAGVTHAQTYVEGGIASLSTDFGDGLKFKPRMLAGIVGYSVHPNLAVEGMLGVNAGKGNTTFTDVNNQSITASLKYTSSYGVFLKPRYAIDPQFEVFARLGYVKSNASSSATSGNASTAYSGSDSDFAYGIGGNYNFDKNLYASLGYMVYYKKDDVKTSGFNFGLGYRF